VPEFEGAADVSFLDLNDCGVIAGTAQLYSDGNFHPFVICATDGPTYLKSLGGHSSAANGINNCGTVVGSSQYKQGDSKAVLWKSPTEIVDLNTLIDPSLGITLHEAFDVNDNGWIIAAGSKPGFRRGRGFVLKPIPQYPPKNVSLSPKSGTLYTNTQYTFTTVYSDPNGNKDLKYCYFVITPDDTLKRSCMVVYDASTNELYVRDDDDTRWKGGFHPGDRNSVENSACKLYGENTSVIRSGDKLTVKWSIRLKDTLKGKNREAFMFVRDLEDLRDGFDKMGSFTIK
jgi:probable HAF family extracellular repeat protein